MKNARWEQLKELFAQALETSASERKEFLRRSCGGDMELLKDALSLIEEHHRSGEFMRPRWLPELDEFEILREIGSGTLGVVYLANERSSNQKVAIKVMRNHGAAAPIEVRNFRIEPTRTAQLDHPGIVPILRVGPRDKAPYFVMECIPGRSLDHVLAECGQPEAAAEAAQIARVILGVADALEHAHSKGLVHQAIKPSNILIDEAGNPHVVDFGLIKVLDDVALQGPVQGTPFYKSPEQGSRRGTNIDHRTDVYSLGVILYEMLTSRQPFVRESYAEITAAIEAHKPERIRDINSVVPLELEIICNRAMQKDASSRYASADRFAADLRRFVDEESVLAQEDTWIERVERRVSRRVATIL